MVPPFVTPHTLCSSWDEQETVFLWTINTTYCKFHANVFLLVYSYVGKAILSKGFWNPKQKLGVTYSFSEIIDRLEPPLT